MPDSPRFGSLLQGNDYQRIHRYATYESDQSECQRHYKLVPLILADAKRLQKQQDQKHNDSRQQPLLCRIVI